MSSQSYLALDAASGAANERADARRYANSRGAVSAQEEVAVYNLTSTRRAPAWASAKQRRELKRDAEHRRRFELLQDFSFPSAAHTVQQCGDGRYIVATGIYPPRVRVYDTSELSMKFERYMDATPVATAVLSDDYTKLAFLQDDRSLELHAAYGRHFRVRIPHFGRCMAWHPPTAELLIGGACADIYRLNLEEGRFMAPLRASAAPARGGSGAAAATGSSSAATASPAAPGVNALAVSRVTAIIASGADGGYVCVHDPRSCALASRLLITGAATARLPPPPPEGADDADPDFASFSDGTAVTALAFDDGGLSLAAGTGDGRILVFDLRRAAPTLVKRHQYGTPITKLLFHRRDAAAAMGGGGGGDEALLLSADRKVVKVWSKETVRTAAAAGVRLGLAL